MEIMEQEKFHILGFFGICQVSTNVILNYPKLFTKLALTLIFPVSFFVIAHDAFIQKTFYSNQLAKRQTDNSSFLAIISSKSNAFWLIKLAYMAILFLFSLPSVSAIAYTIACIYTGKDTTYSKVMSIIPQLLKRLTVTFLWTVCIMFVYNLIMILLLVGMIMYTPDVLTNFDTIMSIQFLIASITITVYLFGLVYITVIWQLASVITVMEKCDGFEALLKSRELMKGKVKIAISIFLVINYCFLVAIDSTGIFVQVEELDTTAIGMMFGGHVHVGGRIVHGFICLVLLTLLFLLGNVVQTMIYFVCKSYHQETIDKSSLVDHLESYLGQYVPLSSKIIELEQVHGQSPEP